MQDFHISATGHSLNYLPQYLARERGYFANEGLNVTISVPEPWTKVLSDLGAGQANAALGGIWVPAMFAKTERHFRPFAQMSNRAPLTLISHPNAAPFAWENMQGKSVAMSGGNGASLGLYFKMVLREQGIDPQDLHFVQDLDNTVLVPCFLSGMTDYLVIDAPSAARLQAEGKARIEQCFTATGGDIPWSVYYAEGLGSLENIDMEQRFTRALGRAMAEVIAEPAAQYADFLARHFRLLPRDALVRTVDTYRALGMWTSPVIAKAPLMRWQKGLVDGGLISQPLSYERLCDLRVCQV